MTGPLLGACTYDDGWPSEKYLHGGPTRWLMVIDQYPTAYWVEGEPGVQPVTSMAWKKVEVCEKCTRRLTKGTA